MVCTALGTTKTLISDVHSTEDSVAALCVLRCPPCTISCLPPLLLPGRLPSSLLHFHPERRHGAPLHLEVHNVPEKENVGG